MKEIKKYRTKPFKGMGFKEEPLPPIYPEDHIFDKSKSVTWNKEQVEKANDQSWHIVLKNRKNYHALVREFDNLMVGRTTEKYKLNRKQAKFILGQANYM